MACRPPSRGVKKHKEKRKNAKLYALKIPTFLRVFLSHFLYYIPFFQLHILVFFHIAIFNVFTNIIYYIYVILYGLYKVHKNTI